MGFKNTGAKEIVEKYVNNLFTLKDILGICNSTRRQEVENKWLIRDIQFVFADSF